MKLSHAFLRTVLTAMLAMFIVTPAMAEPRAWQISESTGQVTINSAGASRPGARGVLLKQGDAVATGPNSRAVLVRGSEFVMLSPNSQVRISKPKESGAITQIYQYLGSALFKIEKKETPHFGVKTPYLAAVVKGTTFNVTVTESGATVQVTEGRVEVSTLDGGAADLIVPGRIARVDANDRQLLRVLGTDDTTIRSPLPPQQDADTEKRSDSTSAKGDDGSSDSNGQISNDNLQTDDTQITQTIADTGKADGFDGRIGSAISGDNVSIAIVTGGLISGSRDNDRAPSDNPGNGNAGGNADNPGNGNAGGNADNPGNGNAGGNADNPGNGNAGGNADNPGNGNAGGNADNPGNGNAGGNADNPGNGNAGGNADNPGNGNAGGNADNPGNGNAGGNADNPGNGNAGGNADNPGNGNAGGNADDGGLIDDVDDLVDDVVNPVKGKKDRGKDD